MEIIQIHWIDTSSIEGWHDRDIVDDPIDFNCHSVGYLLKETREYIMIAQSYQPDQFGDLLYIPQIAIKKKTIL